MASHLFCIHTRTCILNGRSAANQLTRFAHCRVQIITISCRDGTIGTRRRTPAQLTATFAERRSQVFYGPYSFVNIPSNRIGKLDSGVTSHGLSCEVCKFKSHKRCAVKAINNCKWTTLASVGKDIIEDDEGVCA